MIPRRRTRSSSSFPTTNPQRRRLSAAPPPVLISDDSSSSSFQWSTSSSSSDQGTGLEPIPSPITSFLPSAFDERAHFTKYRSRLDRPVLPPSIIHFDLLPNPEIISLFEYQGWIPFLSMIEPYYVEPTRCFYANLRVESPDSLSSYFRENRFTFSTQDIADIIHAPNSGMDIFNLRPSSFPFSAEHPEEDVLSTLYHTVPSDIDTVQSNLMTQDALHLVYFLGRSILPKAGSRTHYSGYYKVLVYCLLKHIRVNLPKLLLDCMSSTHSRRASLCYGNIISVLFRSHNINLLDFPALEPENYPQRMIAPDSSRPSQMPDSSAAQPSVASPVQTTEIPAQPSVPVPEQTNVSSPAQPSPEQTTVPFPEQTSVPAQPSVWPPHHPPPGFPKVEPSNPSPSVPPPKPHQDVTFDELISNISFQVKSDLRSSFDQLPQSIIPAVVDQLKTFVHNEVISMRTQILAEVEELLKKYLPPPPTPSPPSSPDLGGSGHFDVGPSS